MSAGVAGPGVGGAGRRTRSPGPGARTSRWTCRLTGPGRAVGAYPPRPQFANLCDHGPRDLGLPNALHGACADAYTDALLFVNDRVHLLAVVIDIGAERGEAPTWLAALPPGNGRSTPQTGRVPRHRLHSS